MKATLALLLALASTSPAATLVVTGSWFNALSAANLTGGAGTNLNSSYASAPNLFTIDVSGTPVALFYKVYARYTGPSWPGGLSIAIRRTSDGVQLLPSALISGGTSYITLGATDTEIFSGLLDRTNITLQVQVSGVSVALAPASYQAGIVFSITP